ncbi:uncharacterized protein DS421_2g46120 [Arachis hypogaea]|nr:uncharacterized protein DS421_2g46120 [Arachis hypogaea]
MEAFPHFITSSLCFLDLDLGQKGLQKLLGVFSVIFGAWPLSRVRVSHAAASSGVFIVTRSLQSCVCIICVSLMARARVNHAVASITRSRHCHFVLARGRIIHAIASLPVSSKTPFCAFFPFLYVSFSFFKSFLP